MPVQKAKSAKPRKPAAKKANKKAVYQCSVPGCLKSYSWASGLYNHTQSIHLRRKHFCDVPGCLKLFSSSSRLYRHQRIAHQGRRYDCGVPGCLQSYTSTWMLSIHQQTIHEKQGPLRYSWMSEIIFFALCINQPSILRSLGTQIPMRYARLYKVLLPAPLPNSTSRVIPPRAKLRIRFSRMLEALH